MHTTARPTFDRFDARPARRLPPWLLSVALHAVLVVALGLMFRNVSRGLPAEEPGRSVGIVLKSYTDEGERYEGEEGQQSEQTSEAEPEQNPTEAAISALPSGADAPSASEALPQLPTLGPGDVNPGGGGTGSAMNLTQGSRQPGRVTGGKAGVSLYGGPEAVGSKFVFAFDRSDSMVGAPLASAKRELLKGVSQLKKTHQFQIIFFNHRRHIFDLSGGRNRIPFATDQTKERAVRFVGGITASGGTDRYAALWAALGMRPDVIFFLTDADNPMTAAQLERVRRRNDGTSIHCIEFGFGPPGAGDNFLKRLARQNSGSYVYVDTTQL